MQNEMYDTLGDKLVSVCGDGQIDSLSFSATTCILSDAYIIGIHASCGGSGCKTCPNEKHFNGENCIPTRFG